MRVIRYNDKNGPQELEALRVTGAETDVRETVGRIIRDVRDNGDAALFKYALEFDGAVLNGTNIMVGAEETKAAYAEAGGELIGVIRRAADRIRAFHEKQKQNSWFTFGEHGEMTGQLVRPLASCGVYVPGGKAAYPSSVLMNVIPAVVAGVEDIVMVTPVKAGGKVDAAVLVAADTAGVKRIYKVGGAQAVAALAYGTESVPKVDKITGPGNIYVATAKNLIFGQAGIDSIAGPSEILIIADGSANPAYIAADLLSQAEHDEMAQAILVTADESLVENVLNELDRQASLLSRAEIIRKSLENRAATVIVCDLCQAAKISNIIAPEHLELAVNDPMALLPKIHSAGAVFLGHYTPEPLGDYMAGPNHVLPTGGTARFFSPLSVDDYIKKTSVLSFTREAVGAYADDVMRFARAEGLTAHAEAIRVRL